MNNLAVNGEKTSVEHGVVKGSNEGFSGEKNVGATGSREHQTASFSPSNNNWSPILAKMNSTASMNRSPSPVKTDDHKFKIGDAKMPQPPSAATSGTGALPVNPFSGRGADVSFMRNAKK